MTTRLPTAERAVIRAFAPRGACRCTLKALRVWHESPLPKRHGLILMLKLNCGGCAP